MIKITLTIMKFDRQGEKTGWSYIRISPALSRQLKPGYKKSFRVKGKLDNHSIKGISLMPMGDGSFIMPLKGSLRKALRKNAGAKLSVQLEADDNLLQPPAELIECLKDEPAALEFFNQLSYSHKNYFGNWIRSAKTENTKTKRLTQCINALSKKYDFGQMLRSMKKQKEDLFEQDF